MHIPDGWEQRASINPASPGLHYSLLLGHLGVFYLLETMQFHTLTIKVY